MEGNGGAERPGHVADEHGGTPVRKKPLGARQCRLTRARQRQWRRRRGGGSSGGAFSGLAWPEMGRRARAESLTRGGARRGRERREERALEREWRPAAARGGVVVSKWRCWGWQAGSRSTYGHHGASTRRSASDWRNWIGWFNHRRLWLKPDLRWRFTHDSLGSFCSDLSQWIELHEFYKFA